MNQDVCITPMFLGATCVIVFATFEIFNMFLMDSMGISIKKVKSKLDAAEAEIDVLMLNNRKLEDKNAEYETKFTEFISRLETQLARYEAEVIEFKSKLDLND